MNRAQSCRMPCEIPCKLFRAKRHAGAEAGASRDGDEGSEDEGVKLRRKGRGIVVVKNTLDLCNIKRL